MNILSIPFHQFLNIKKSANSDYIFQAEERPEYANHIGTIHACLQLSLAEASSGEFLLQQFNKYADDVIPVVRKTEAKYHRPAKGILYSRAILVAVNKSDLERELIEKRRAIIQIKVEIFDGDKKKVLSATFDWFVQMKA